MAFAWLVLFLHGYAAAVFLIADDGYIFYETNDTSIELACKINESITQPYVFFSTLIKNDVFGTISLILIDANSDTCSIADNPGGATMGRCDTTEMIYSVRTPSVDNQKFKCSVIVGSANVESEAIAVLSVVYVETAIIKTGGTVLNIEEGHNTSVECESSPVCRPRAEIRWYKSGKGEIINGLGSNIYTTDQPDTTLVKTKRTLTYIGNRSDNGGTLYCKAKQRATEVNATSSIQLNITYPPSTQIVISVLPTGILLENDLVNVTCYIEGGNPLSTLALTCNGQQGHKHDTFTTAISVLTFTANSSYDGKTCTCIATHPVNNFRLENTTIIAVQYAPIETPRITQFPSNYVVAGNTVILTCEVYGGKPLPELIFTNCGSSVINNSSGNKASYSVSFMVSKIDNMKTCNCSATHPVKAYRPTVYHKIVVYYIPESQPSISQLPEGHVDTGVKITLTCKVIGGNPLPELTWNCGKDVINNTAGNIASYSVSFEVNKDDNGRQCNCTAKHPITSYRPIIQHALTVYYPPNVPSLGVNLSLTLFEGNETELTCYVDDGGNPKPTFMWMWNQTNIPVSASHTLKLGPLDKNDNGAEITCKVRNNYSDEQGMDLNATKTLNVEFYPIVIVDGSTKTVIEGEKINLKCTIFGNPTPTGKWFKEEKEQSFISDGQILSFIKTEALRDDNGQYQCEAISTSSLYGKLVTSEYMQLIINYPPDVNIDDISNQDNKEAVYVCNAFGNPNNYSYMGWEQTYNDVVIRDSNKLALFTAENSRKLKLSALSYHDSGNYTCFVNNGVPDRSGQYRQFGRKKLNVKGSPLLLHALPPDDTYSAERGGNITISLQFFTFPDIIDALWYKNSSNLPIITDEHSNLTTTIEGKAIETRFHNVNVNVSDYAYQTILKLRNLDEKMEGTYTLAIRNGFKDKNITIFVLISSKPDNPSDLNVTMTTATGITISWYRGYSGGHKQIFNISVFDNRGFRLTQLINDNHTVLMQIFSIKNLEPSTVYVIRLYSLNKIGKSNVIQINATTEATVADQVADQPVTSSLVGGIAGSISALLIVLIVIVAFYLWRRRREHGGDKELIKRRTTETDEDEDGLKDNPLYATSEQPLDTEVGPMYGVVNKQKQNNQKMNTDEGMDKGPVYSQVQKSNAQGKKKENEKRVKKTEKNGNNKMNIEMGSVYENSDKFTKGRDENEIYANTESNNAPSKSQNECNNPLKKNKDGLIYADLDLAPSGKRFVIRGIENRNNYAIIDLSKTAEPLPSDDEDVDEEKNETDSTTKKDE